MYLPTHFEETEINAIEALMDAFPLATLVAQTKDGLVANHIPMIKTGDNELSGHIALNNNLHEVLENGAEILLIFQGEDSYISPNYYPTKQDHHKHVPTWNYQVVHVHGTLHFSHDKKQKAAMVGRLTKLHEQKTNGDKAWKMADAPRDYIDTMLDNIVAFKVGVTRVIGKSKLGQNREKVDYENVIIKMDESCKPRLAKRMRELGDG